MKLEVIDIIDGHLVVVVVVVVVEREGVVPAIDIDCMFNRRVNKASFSRRMKIRDITKLKEIK